MHDTPYVIVVEEGDGMRTQTFVGPFPSKESAIEELTRFFNRLDAKRLKNHREWVARNPSGSVLQHLAANAQVKRTYSVEKLEARLPELKYPGGDIK
jgi:hypothetical protein